MLAQNVGIGTNNPTEKLEVNGIIFTSQGGIKFPDGTIQTTAAPTTFAPGTTSNKRNSTSPPNILTGLVIEFSSGILNGPASGPGFTNGINIFDVKADFEITADIVGGVLSTSLPSFSNVSFSRVSDELSAKIPLLVANNFLIPHIRVYHLRLSGGGVPLVDKITVYEDCILDGYSFSSSNISFANEHYHDSYETVSFFFTKVCFREFKYDDVYMLIGQVDSCWDRETQTGGVPGDPGVCSCSF